MDDYGNYYSHGWTNPDYAECMEPHFHAYIVGLCIHAYGVCDWHEFY